MQGDEVSLPSAPGYLAQDGGQDPAIRRVIDARRIPGRGRIAANDQAGIHTEGSGSSSGFTEIVLHSFTGNPGDAVPGLIMDSAGNLYGTIMYAGTANAGIVYKVDPTGKMTVLYNFQGGTDGYSPRGSLIRDSAGNLYGTTFYGGTAGNCSSSGCGTVFKLDPTGKETVLYSFQGGTDGSNPNAGLTMDSAGNLCGTTENGGTAGDGTVFKVDPTGKETLLYSFQGGTDGILPSASLIMDSAGNLYGTTYVGGMVGAGTVFKVDRTGKETVLYSFQAGTDGANPSASLITDSAGNLYGTTTYGGSRNSSCSAFGCGTVFKLDPTGKETILHSFSGTSSDGAGPVASLIIDSSGILYGTTEAGGTSSNCAWFGCGTIFTLDPTGKVTLLHSFQGGTDGEFPFSSLIMDNAGNLYGTTGAGGAVDGGTVFELDPTGKEAVLYSFTYRNDDAFSPTTSLIMDTTGNLYGTTEFGGPNANGSVFKLDATGSETVFYSFPDSDSDGLLPAASLIMDGAGNMYGTTLYGGTSSNCGPLRCGTIFKLDPTGKETVLYSFQGGTDGENPSASLIMDGAGNLYGTTIGGSSSSYCGSLGCGTVFKVDPTGKGTVLHGFQGGTDGKNPYASLIMDGAGNLYGTTESGGTGGVGTVFKVDSTGKEAVLYSFQGGTDGEYPYAGLIIDSAGNLYGTTQYGGTASFGTVFKVDATGKETVLYSFQAGADGAQPYASLIMDSAGNLYGTTFFGGTGSQCGSVGCGTVFKLDPTGKESVLYSFQGGTDGVYPRAGLIMDSAGNVYGTTEFGGSLDEGTVFELIASGGNAAPIASLSSGSLSFASQLVSTTSAAQAVTLSNTGSAPLSLTNITFTGANSGDFSQTDNCGTSLALGATCSISVKFTPSASGSRSASLSITDNAAGSPHTVALSGTGEDFSLSAASGGATSATVTAGQPASYNLQVSPLGGFTGSVAVSCTGAPTQAVCMTTTSPVSVTGASPAPFTVTVTTSARSWLPPSPGTRFRPPIWILPLEILALFLTLSFATSRVTPRTKRRYAWAYAGLLLLCLASLAACGGGSSAGGGGGGGGGGTPAGTYTLTVTGSVQGVQRTVNLSLTVN